MLAKNLVSLIIGRGAIDDDEMQVFISVGDRSVPLIGVQTTDEGDIELIPEED